MLSIIPATGCVILNFAVGSSSILPHRLLMSRHKYSICPLNTLSMGMNGIAVTESKSHGASARQPELADITCSGVVGSYQGRYSRDQGVSPAKESIEGNSGGRSASVTQ